MSTHSHHYDGEDDCASTAPRWCILRTAGLRTLPLAKSLAAVGIGVWTPTILKSRRLSRNRGKVERPLALLPTYVFAHADDLGQLMEIHNLEISDHPQFSIFRFRGEIVRVKDRELEPLRTAEKREVPKAKRPTFKVGAEVTMPEGPFVGLTGVVKRSDGRYTLVGFGGALNIEIETFQLRSDDIDGSDRSVA